MILAPSEYLDFSVIETDARGADHIWAEKSSVSLDHYPGHEPISYDPNFGFDDRGEIVVVKYEPRDDVGVRSLYF